ncbi:hypothetical protein D0T49_07645 [Paludibacter sp. 221]|nr:hypothetical protein [Paludibacter sp. 221]
MEHPAKVKISIFQTLIHDKKLNSNQYFADIKYFCLSYLLPFALMQKEQKIKTLPACPLRTKN